jgi:S1-C subfamily serine protease
MIHLNGRLESLISLNMALESNFCAELTPQQSATNIKNNIVGVYAVDEITSRSEGEFTFRGSFGSGLLITTDGFILTAYHVISDYIDDWNEMANVGFSEKNILDYLAKIVDEYFVADQEGRRYAIDISFVAYDKGRDLALIKAVIPKKPQPAKFLVDERGLWPTEKVFLIGYPSQKIYKDMGKVITPNHDAQWEDPKTGKKGHTLDSFLTNAKIIPGCSGGAFINSRGQYAGVISYRGDDETDSGGVKVSFIKKLLRKVRYEENKKMLE